MEGTKMVKIKKISFNKCLIPFFIICFLYASQTFGDAEIFEVGEMIGKVTDTQVEIFMQVSDDLDPSVTNFKIFYDTNKQSNIWNYAYSTPAQNTSPGDKLTFYLTDGIQGNIRYYYRVGCTVAGIWQWRDERSFHTPRQWRDKGSFHTQRSSVTSNEEPQFTFCVISDFHPSIPFVSGQNYLEQIAANVAADAPDFVITLGDMVDISDQGQGVENCDGLDSSYRGCPLSQLDPNCFDRHYRDMAETLGVFSGSSMIVWINGNHEGLLGYLNNDNETCSYNYNKTWDAREKYFPIIGDEGYVAGTDVRDVYGDFTWGDVHIIWLDPLAFSTEDPLYKNDPRYYALGSEPYSEHYIKSDQQTWLETTLSQSQSKFKLIFAHTLFGGCGPECSCCSPGLEGGPEASSYARGGADYVCDLYGTDQCDIIHLLMRWYGVSGYFYGHDHVYAMTKKNNVKYFCVGTGSKDWLEEPIAPVYQYDIKCLYPNTISGDTFIRGGKFLNGNYLYLEEEEICSREDPKQEYYGAGHMRVDVYDNRLVIKYVKANPYEPGDFWYQFDPMPNDTVLDTQTIFVCGDVYPREVPPDKPYCGDGEVDIFDILGVIDIVLGVKEPTECQEGRADVSTGTPPYCTAPDGEIDIFDVLVLIKKALGKPNCCDFW